MLEPVLKRPLEQPDCERRVSSPAGIQAMFIIGLLSVHLLFGQPADSTVTISGIDIHLSEPSRKEKSLLALAREILFLHKGDAFSPTGLQQAVENLKLSKKFSTIEVDSREEPDGMRLIFQLTPAVYIKTIDIEGQYPLFTTEVLNAMSLYPGDIYSKSTVEKQKKIIRDLFVEEGFPRAKVTITGKKESEFYTLRIQIDRGPPRVLKSLKVTGNKQYGDFRVKWGFSAWRAGFLPYRKSRFQLAAFKREVEALQKKYWEGSLFRSPMPEAVVRPQFMYSNDSLEVEARLEVTEGPEYLIEIEGNDALSKRNLKKAWVFQQRGNQDNLGIEVSKKNMLNKYAERGYHHTTLRVEESLEPDDGKKRIVFKIQEGPQSRVHSLKFNGNKFLNAETLRKSILSTEGKPFVPDVWVADQLAIRSAYHQAGFPQASLSEKTEISEDHKNVGLSLTIEENGRKTIEKVEVKGYQNVLPQKKARDLIQTSPGQPYRKGDLRRDAHSLEEAISEKGYPHVGVSMDTASHGDSTKVAVTYNIDTGPKVTLQGYHFTGNFKTGNQYLKREVDLSLREPLSLKKLLQGQKNLQDHPIFKSVHVKPIGLAEKSERVHLFIEVEEKKPLYLQAGGGFESENGFFTQAKVGDRNLWGANKHAWVGAGIQQIGLPELGYELATGITDPKLFHTSVSASLDFYYKNLQKRNLTFRTKTFGTSTSFNRRFFHGILGGLTFVYENREVEGEVNIPQGTDSVLVLEAARPRNALVTTPSFLWDTRDSFIRPKSGFFSSLSLDLSLGMDNQLDDFNRYALELRHYLTPFSRLTFAVAGRAEFIHNRHDEVIVSPDQLFYSGGTNSVRGFAENKLYLDGEGNPVGGKRSLALNVESRVGLGLGFETAFFWDVGQLHDGLTTGLSENYRMALGTGLRYITPIGPVGILYGHKLFRRTGEAPGQWHFSLGYTF